MRKLATALAVSIALSSGSAHALSLGEIEMRSALNQPMSAEIQLSSVRPGELQNMIVKLASPEAFARAGIDRTDVLSDLEFSINEANQSIVITSRRPVVEPFLNFLLEIDWPAGRMVREYTVLLDPPVFLSANTSSRSDTAADSSAIVQRGDTSLVTPQPIQRESFIAEGEIIDLEVIDSQAIGEVPLAESVVPGAGLTGEIISLDDLGRDTVVTDSVDLSGGEVIGLTDLRAPNPQARAEFNANQLPEVELFGGGSEAGSFSDSAPSVSTSGSEVVSLDGLGSPADVTGGSVVVQRGDTLGVIAQRVASSGVSPQQMMLALLAANESAFINGNVNLVKAGATLRIPSASEASGISQAEATASMNDQNRLWQEYRDSVRSGRGATQVASASQASQSRSPQQAEPSSLTADAAAILENARTEVLRSDELNIVASNDSASTAASATSDESTESNAGRLGEINRKLQLAREELASSRLETGDLADQSDALRDTGENLDTLVTLQQNDIAKLEAQLEAAKDNASPTDALTESADALGDTVADAAGSATDAASDLADSASDLVGGAAADAQGAASNALAGAGEQLDSVELVADNAAGDVVDSANATAAAAVAGAGSAATEAAAAPKSWLDGVMSSNLKWIPIGLGAVFGLGLLGTLFMGRRKRKALDEADLDDVEFLDEVDSVEPMSASGMGSVVDDEVDSFSKSASSGVSSAAAVGGAGAVAAAAAVGFGGNDSDEDVSADHGMASDSASASGVDELDHDDTISEVDVYLAYGLHGQAEELLTKAIDRDSDNPEYQAKLLETYAAQGNSEGYSEAAAQFHNKFGESNEAWLGIATRGLELDPGNALYSGSSEEIASVGVGRYDEAPSMDNNDFLSDSDSSEVASTSRGFGDNLDGLGSDLDNDLDSGLGDSVSDDEDEDETHLMDQSIDPAFAFDEADLEATGDFSQIAGEIAADGGDDTSSLDFPSFDSAADSITDSASGIAGTVGDKASDAMNDTSLGLAGAGAAVAGLAASKLDLNAPATASEDLTLDLDQLSGDMELDSTELLDDSLNSAEGLNFDSTGTSDDTLLAGTGSLESVDEMDTMMDLAKAYIDMGDNDSASSALDEIVKSGNPQQVSEAETLKQKIS